MRHGRTTADIASRLALALLALAGCRGAEASKGGATYEVVHGWPALSEGFVLGQVSGVAIDSNQDVVLFHRGSRPWFGEPRSDAIASPTILRLDGATGEIVDAFGAGRFVIPHGLRIDDADHLWITDVGTHRVYELSPDGAVLRTLGTGRPGRDRDSFDQPTDVWVAPDGSFYVADGYGNSRIVKFSRDGAFELEWGEPGTGPGQFDTPHSISGDAQGRIYVADRGNARIQRFDAGGSFLDEWKNDALGRPWAVTAARDGSVYVVDGGDQNPEPPDRGRVLRLDAEGRILDSFASFGNYDGQIYWGHDVAVDRDGAVYVGDVFYGMRVQKFVRR